jgi:hypothetical protein
MDAGGGRRLFLAGAAGEERGTIMHRFLATYGAGGRCRLVAPGFRAAWFAVVCGATALAAPSPIAPDRPNTVAFPPAKARYVRLVIHASSRGQPCIDELEVYGPDGKANLARADAGAKAAASSCLPGYAIHRIAHLNDGRYGNAHSWIAAGTEGEWAQIELPRAATIARVVFSRDRDGKYRDRVPIAFEIRLSVDGTAWRTVAQRGNAVPWPLPALPAGPFPDEDLLRYAFACEARALSRAGVDPVAHALRQMEELADRLAARGLDVSAERAELAALRRRAADRGDPDAARAAFVAVRRAKRRLFLRDPGLAPLGAILFVKRHPFRPSHNYSDLLDARGGSGGGIYLLRIPFVDGYLEPEAATLVPLFETCDGVCRDPVADFAARRIYFAVKAAPDAYFRLTAIDPGGGNRETLGDGPFHDFYPCPLPDGGLAFVSTRCKARFLCWRPQTYVLFRMDAGGGNIRSLSHANLSEWAPSVMGDGRILWTRSEYLDKGADFGHTLWAIRPDGTHPELIFGNNTRYCYVGAREVPETGELCCILMSHGGDLNGPVALVRRQAAVADPAAVRNITPDVKPHFHMSWAQRACFRDPFPIGRDLVLCSHAPDDRFGLYVIDRNGNREVLYLDPALGSMAPSPFRALPTPPVVGGGASLPDDRKPLGRCFVSDVYRGLGPAVKRGTVKYLRICEEVRADLLRLPDGGYRKDHPEFQDWYATPTHKVRGPHGWPSYVAKASLGLVPVEADGSAHFYAPAGKVIYFQALDERLHEQQRMRSVLQLQPGETRGCIGCHESRLEAPTPRPTMALRRSPSVPQPPPWGAVPFSYEEVVQPVWDARCVRCHDASDAKGFDLSGARDADKVPASYRTLIEGGWVHYFDYTWGREHDKAAPLTFGTVKSRLLPFLEPGHHDVRLTADERRAVTCWIDLNVPLWPDYLYRPER